MDARRAFDRFERSGAGWLPLLLMILAATALTGVTLMGVGLVKDSVVLQPIGEELGEPAVPPEERFEEPYSDE